MLLQIFVGVERPTISNSAETNPWRKKKKLENAVKLRYSYSPLLKLFTLRFLEDYAICVILPYFYTLP